MNEQKIEVIAVPKDSLNKVLDGNNRYFFNKGWDRGFFVGIILTFLFAVGGAIIALAGIGINKYTMKNAKEDDANGSESVHEQQQGI